MIVRLIEGDPEDFEAVAFFDRLYAIDEQGDFIGVATDFGVVPLMTGGSEITAHVLLLMDVYKIAHFAHRMVARFDVEGWVVDESSKMFVMGLDEKSDVWLR